MRSVRRGRLVLLGAAAVVATSISLASAPSSAAPTTACPEGPVCIAVKIVQTVDGVRTQVGANRYYYPADIQALADVEDRQYYKRRNPDGETVELTKPARALSLFKLLTDIGEVDIDGPDGPKEPRGLVDLVSFSEAAGPRGVPVVLSAADLADPDPQGEDFDEYPFLDGLPPMVYVTDGKIRYVRPLRDAGSDTNAADIVTTSKRFDLIVNTTGRLLEPTVSASSTNVTTKDKPTFTVAYKSTPRTRITKVRWSFGDGTTKGISGSKRSHSFDKRGTYPVFVEVRGDNGSYGRSAPVEIKVGKPPNAPRPSAGTGSGGSAGGSTGFVPPYTPGLDDVPFEDVPDEDVPREGDPEQTPDVPVDDGLEPVEGWVLAGAETVPGGTPEAIPGTQDSSSPTPAAKESQRTRIATWVVAAFVTLLLVGAGAASETRWTRIRLRHLRRRA